MAETQPGYFRYPDIHEEQIVFTAEGDLWLAPRDGGTAQRLTSHHGMESCARFSPDGLTIAFSAEYEGPQEVYTMPVNGGQPTRRTWEGETAEVIGWVDATNILYRTQHYSTLPNTQLVALDIETFETRVLPLAQASDGEFDDQSRLFFTRLAHQGSHTRRYQGGSVEQLWRFDGDGTEAIPLTVDYPGTSRCPMLWRGRLYFVSDRDGSMNLWSAASDGSELKQLTFHTGWDIATPAQHNGSVIYQLGADLRRYDIDDDNEITLTLSLVSDFDHRRTRWVKRPMEYLNTFDLSHDASHIAMTARGRVFVNPLDGGRLMQATQEHGVRFRDASFLPASKSLLILSDATGEFEYWRYPQNGIGEAEQLTSDGKVLRHGASIAPDGSRFAYLDLNSEMWLFDITSRTNTCIARSDYGGFEDLAWSADSRWLAYVTPAENMMSQIQLYDAETRDTCTLTSDRVDSYGPTWSPDGRWLYFISDRDFKTVVPSPWGPRQPEPYVHRSAQIYMLALTTDTHGPFDAPHELLAGDAAEEGTAAAEPSESTEEETTSKDDKPDTAESGAADQGSNALPALALDGLADRIKQVPLPAGRYMRLHVTDKRLIWTESTIDHKVNLMSVAIEPIGGKKKALKPALLVDDIRNFATSGDGKKLLVLKKSRFFLLDANAPRPEKFDEKAVDMKRWTFTVEPVAEWRQIFIDAWRMERDYFYDRDMHGVDWPAVLQRHLPLVERVTDRHELNDLIAHMVSELSALHTFVRGGELRRGDDQIPIPSLGVLLARDAEAGGYRISHIYQTEPEFPNRRAPVAQPGMDVQNGDLITAINGIATLDVVHPAELLKNQTGQQMLATFKSATNGEIFQRVVKPMNSQALASLRYDDWEYTRRLRVEEAGQGNIGYVHLRAMSAENYQEWVRHYYPVFNRQGLIIDVRNNRGGNIDSWILEKLLRRAWFYWQPRVGKPSWNMQYAFRGHMVVICNEHTSSDGEAFAEGFRRLGLGQLIGTRTWGGEIWLSFNNPLVDRGFASAAQTGVFSPEGEWLIEGHGVEPDIVVDNLPHATFNGADAQLDAAVAHLQELLVSQPVEPPVAPPHPDKSHSHQP
jgi:tricorn protease